MSPAEYLTRGEFEDRMTAVRREFADAQLAQDAEFNKGFRAIRDDVKHGIDLIREDVGMRADGLERLFMARLDPVRAVAYGMVGFLVLLLGAQFIGVLKR